MILNPHRLISYVIQHIDPVYYPLVLDFCRSVSKKYVAIDVFWNPARINVNEFTKVGSVSWYGLSYEELLTLVASRFRILNSKVRKTSISFVMNLLLIEGNTNIKYTLDRNYEYNSNRIGIALFLYIEQSLQVETLAERQQRVLVFHLIEQRMNLRYLHQFLPHKSLTVVVKTYIRVIVGPG